MRVPTSSSALRRNLQTLEDRCVPAAAPGVFATFAGDQGSLAVRVRTADFGLSAGRVLVSFEVHADTDPGPVTVMRGQTAVKQLVSRADVAGGTSSLSIAPLTARAYTVQMPGGPWQLDVTLAGDANGDFRVNRVDLDLIRGQFDVKAGDAAYTRQADVDGDGAIARADLNLAIKNLGAATTLRPFALVAGIDPASDPDGNHIVLKSKIDLSGQARRGVTVRADVDANGTFDGTALTDAAGHYRLGITLTPGTHEINVLASDGFGQTAMVRQEVSLGDVVLDWNAVHLTSIRDYTVFSQVPYANRIVTTPPALAARNLAMVHAAMYDAINAVEHFGQPYHVDLTASAGTSASAAAAMAAYRLLSNLYPGPEQIGLFGAALAESLAAVPDGAGKDAGIALGRQVADAMLTWRSTDGSKTTVAYTQGTDPGDWRRTLPDFLPPQLPQWPGVKTFGVPDATAYRAPPPPELTSPEYTAAFNQVKELGRFDSTTRTPEQTDIALFWADGPGTATPSGHWNRIAEQVAFQRGDSLAENARTFALLNVAMADAGIACWDSKYYYNLWRPVAAIREAAGDGNDLTTPNATWSPLLKTPPFPTYTSGHSTFSGAAATVLTAIFGSDVSFTHTSDGLDGFTQRPLASVITRTFANFQAAADEAGQSRIFGGIHYEFDCTAGMTAGRAIGDYVVEHLFGTP